MLSSESSPPAERESDAPAEASARPALPRVLVLLAARNGARWIREQVDSVLAQEGVDVRLTVRDDGSTDGTQQELARFATERRVRTLAGSAPTGSAAGNFLALIRENAADEADFVAFCDQDDLWHRDKLIRACRTITAEGAVGYSSATIAFWEDGRQATLRPASATNRSDFLFEGAGQGCTFVLSRDFYARLRALIASHSELTRGLHYHDWAAYALARAWGSRWSFDPTPSLRYRQHGRNDTGARGTLAGLEKRISLVRRGWYARQLAVIAELCSVAAPLNATVAAWRATLLQPDNWHRRLQIALFCLRGGRRRRRDNAILVLAALQGWI